MGISKSMHQRAEESMNLIEKPIKLHQQISLLLLGAEGSGKSTFLQQLLTIYSEGPSERTRRLAVEPIRKRICADTVTLVKHMIRISDNTELVDHLNKQVKDLVQCKEISMQLKILTGIYDLEFIQTCFKDDGYHSATFDPCIYHSHNVVRIFGEDYVPSNEDLIRTRRATTGINESWLSHQGHTFRITDVGGQRHERRKWKTCFTDVTAIVYCVSLSGYNETILEEPHQNRMHESLELFRRTVNQRPLQKKHLILLFNKSDLFEKLLKFVPLSDCFKNYNGPDKFNEAFNFVKLQYQNNLDTSKERYVYFHVTCNIDKKKVGTTFEQFASAVVQHQLENIDPL